MVWNTSFEGQPIGENFGSISCKSMRDLLTEFYNRLSLEHTITEGVAPTATHTPGMCGVCNVVAGFPNSKGLVGGISFDKTGHRLYIDDSAVMTAIGGIDHSLFSLNALLETAHTQYLLTNASAGFDTLTGILTCKRISGLDVTLAHYSGVFYPEVLPRVLHKGIDVNGGNKHADQSFYRMVALGTDKLKIVDAQIYSGSPAVGDYSSEISLGEFSFMPYVDIAGSAVGPGVAILPDFIDTSGTFPSAAALSPKIFLYCVYTGGTIAVRCKQVSAT